MRSTLPTTILSIVLASGIHSSSASLYSRFFGNDEPEANTATRNMEQGPPSCDETDIENFISEHMIENPYKHNDTYAITNSTGTKKLATFTGTAEDHAELTGWCNGHAGRIVYTNIDYTEECEKEYMLEAVKMPICVPKKCVGNDWTDAIATYSDSLHPTEHCKPLVVATVLR